MCLTQRSRGQRVLHSRNPLCEAYVWNGLSHEGLPGILSVSHTRTKLSTISGKQTNLPFTSNVPLTSPVYVPLVMLLRVHLGLYPIYQKNNNSKQRQSMNYQLARVGNVSWIRAKLTLVMMGNRGCESALPCSFVLFL